MIPAGDWIASVMSNTGKLTSGAYCPCLYQLTYIIDNTGNVAVSAQYWGWTYGSIYSYQINSVGSTSTIDLDGLTYHTSSGIQSKGFVYSTLYQEQHNLPTIYTFTAQNTGDTQFWYGTTTSCGTTLHFYQMAVESPTTVKSGYWNVDQYVLEAYDYGSSSWVYAAGKSIEGSHAAYNCVGGTVGLISGQDMPGVKAVATSADSVSWGYTGTTEGNDVSLWTGSGGSTPFPCAVSGRC